MKSILSAPRILPFLLVGLLILSACGLGMPEPTATPPPPVNMRERPLDGMAMAYVPAGTFAMGSENSHGDEQPVHNVELDDFWIDRTEVTNAQYAACVAGGVCNQSSLADDSDFNGPNHPVVGVTWSDAETYCTWVGGRLPTEAEWEYAARGSGRLEYPWGNTFVGENLNFCDAACESDRRDGTVEDGYAATAPVGTYPAGASWIGALDMAGNVWEWVNDWYAADYYQTAPDRNPQGPESGDSKSLRGGSWSSFDVEHARTAFRASSAPASSGSYFGFRCIQE